MKILFGTSILVEIERNNGEVMKLIDLLAEKNVELVLSIVTLSEMYLGAFLQKDSEKILLKMKSILNIFKWHEIDAKTAEELAKIQAYKILNGMHAEYQDSAIAASCIVSHSDFLLTLNIKHFQLPSLKNKVYTPQYFYQLVKQGKIKLS